LIGNVGVRILPGRACSATH